MKKTLGFGGPADSGTECPDFDAAPQSLLFKKDEDQSLQILSAEQERR
jgi:hypothetical protein